ncbi:hypothetical protein P879_11238 [Paragonimus westermani]|uniref:ubiquitinyl hydrolase 1 n=1 Tax=Paragonimus westermani TaxID=34504 RepID=A0A8T0D3T1_9TREM|nr:hypothetical protein P879_11238 [Paragonimus westermani]
MQAVVQSCQVRQCKHNTYNVLPVAIIDKFRGSTCRLCSYSGKNQWLCLHDGCYFVGCGPKGSDHSSKHAELLNHPISVNLHNLQVFCHPCDSKISFPDISEPRKGCVTSESWVNACSGSSDCPPEAEVASCLPQMFQNSYGISPFRKLSLGVCGLPNLGNTCYMNAALQALSNCPQITEYFLQCSELIDSSRSLMAVHYQNLLGRIWLPPRSTVVSPLPILREVKCAYPMFSGYSQHDAQEFLRVFLNHLHDELKTTSTTPSIINNTTCQNDGDVRSSDITLTDCDRCSDRPPVIRNKGKIKRNRSKSTMGADGDDDCSVCYSLPSAPENVAGELLISDYVLRLCYCVLL